jgi:hypothetical protein
MYGAEPGFYAEVFLSLAEYFIPFFQQVMKSVEKLKNDTADFCNTEDKIVMTLLCRTKQ